MPLTVENGAGVADADSYLSLVDARALAENYGIVLPVDDTEAEVQLRNGYRGLNVIEPQLQGSRTHDIQTGIFPRKNVLVNCVALDSETITLDVKLAQLYQTDAYVNGGDSNNTVDDGERLSGFKVVGVYEETYQDGSSSSTNSRVQGVYNALFPYTVTGYNQSPCGKGSGFGNGCGREEFGSVGV